MSRIQNILVGTLFILGTLWTDMGFAHIRLASETKEPGHRVHAAQQMPREKSFREFLRNLRLLTPQKPLLQPAPTIQEK